MSLLLIFVISYKKVASQTPESSINLVPGKLLRNGSGFNFVPNSQNDGFNIPLGDYPFENEPAEGQEIIFGIRPEHICIPNPSLKTQMSVELKPTLIENTGYEQNVTFDFQGNEEWSVPLDWVPRRDWGAASSPILHDGRIYIVNDSESQSYVAAYEASTGNEIWRTDRDEATNWSTPFVWENDVRTELVTTGRDGVRSYSMEGDVLWELHGMSSLVIPTPFAAHDLLFINSGYIADSHRPVYAVRAGAAGDISLGEGSTSNDYVVWSHPQLGSYNPSSLVYGDYHYTLLDRGILMVYDARTGVEVYPRKRVTAGTLFTASPWAYNGKIFALSEDGDTFVIKAGDEFELIGKNSLNEMTMATPAIARGSIFLRTASKLYRIAENAGN